MLDWKCTAVYTAFNSHTGGAPVQKLNMDELDRVSGGDGKRDRYVSAFYCEYCQKTIHLNMVYSLERAKKEHNAKFHPQVR